MQDYQRHLTSQSTDNDDFGPSTDGDKENLPMENLRAGDMTDSYHQDALLGTGKKK